MKRNSLLIIPFITFFIVFLTGITEINSSSLIEQIKPTAEEIPEGYMFGQVPKFAQNVLKNNPWSLDKDAIKRMTGRIYPGGEYTKVSDLHMSIITNKNKPYGSDMGCYIFIFRDKKAAQEELMKLKEYVNNNSDRSIIIDKSNLAVYLYVNNTKNFEYIKTISGIMKKRMDKLPVL